MKRGNASEYLPGPEENSPASAPPSPKEKAEAKKIAAERAVIGALLSESLDPLPPAVARVIQFAPDSFDDLRYGAIAKAMKLLLSQGKPLGTLTVLEAVNGDLSRDPNLLGYLASLQSPLGSELAEYEASLVWESFRCRRLKTVYLDANAAMESSPAKADSVALAVQRSIADLGPAKDERSTFSLRLFEAINAMQFDDSDRILGDRLLAKGQSLVISGAGSLGKSRFVLQMIAAIVAGIPFVSLETRGENLRFLILQAENSNRRLQQDIQALKDWLNPPQWQRVNDQCLIHTLESDADFFLSLDQPRACDNISASIQSFKPDCIIFDSLYNFAIGDLNQDEDMAATLLAISRLSKEGNPDRCPIVLHHATTGKAGAMKALGYDRTSFSRNSKVLHSWTRGQINISPGSPDPNDGLLVLSCGKCSNGKEFPPFAVRLNPDTLIYELQPDFDLDDWQDEIQGKEKPSMSPAEISKLLAFPMTRKELRLLIQDRAGVTRQTANRYIRSSIDKDLISWDEDKDQFTAK